MSDLCIDTTSPGMMARLIAAIERMGPASVYVEADDQGRPRVVKLEALHDPLVRERDRLRSEVQEGTRRREALIEEHRARVADLEDELRRAKLELGRLRTAVTALAREVVQ